jgi:hypothetical protein
VPSFIVTSSINDKTFVQTVEVGVNEITSCVGVAVNASVVGSGVMVARGCVGGIDVGGRNGVGAGGESQLEVKKMMKSRIKYRLRKRRFFIIKK